MTVTALPARNEYTASAGQTIFNYTFKIYANTDLNVYVTPAGQDANDSTDLTTSYTVAGVGDENGGSITLVTPTSAGDRVTIVSDIPENRTVDYQDNGDFIPSVVNNDFDRVVSLVKQVEDVVGRTVSFEESQQNAVRLSLPAPEAGQLMRWKSDLSGLENIEIEGLPGVEYETVSLTDGQTDVTFSVVVSTASFYINGTDADNGRLVAGTDFTFNASTNTVTLAESYPAGTTLTAAGFESEAIESSTGVKSYSTVADMKAASLSVNETVITKGYYTAGDGGGAEYLISASQAVDGYGDHALSNGNVALIQTEVPTAKQYGAVGDGVADDTAALDALKDSGKKIIKLGDSGDVYLRSSNWQFNAANSDLIVEFGGATLKTTSQFGVYVPAVGDGFAGVAGASNLTIIDPVLDGTGSAASSIGLVSWNAVGLRVVRPEFNNWLLSGSVVYGLAAGATTAFYSEVKATGNTNHGMAVSTVEVDASRVVIDGILSWSNGLGLDISTGSATVSNIIAWDNTNGGMKTAGNDDQHLILSNADLSNNTNGAAQGFYTNGTFKLIEMSNVRCNNNGAQGIQVAHAGTVLASGISAEGNGNIGFHQSGAANVIIDEILSKSNTGRGILISAGDCQIGKARTELNTRVGILISSLGVASVESHISVDDCTVSDNNALFCQPASNAGRYSIGNVLAVDTAGSGGVTTAVSLNSQTTQAALGSVQVVGAAITAPISDSGTNNSYLNANGRAQMPFDRIGFYGSAPLAKQSITGAKGGNAALTDLLTKLASLGLIIDSTT